VSNAEYNSNGYFYGIKFAQPVSGTVNVQVYDPGFCSSSPDSGSSGTSFTTTFTLRAPGSNPPSAPVIATNSYGYNANCGVWTTVGSISNPLADTYYLQVQANYNAGNSRSGSNAFAIRASVGAWNNATSPCTQDAADANFSPANPQCPNVFGYGAMGVYANIAGAQPQFYLAQTTPADNGKKMQIDLFDPGEGAQALQIITPNNQVIPFTWEVLCWNPAQNPCTDVAPTGGWSGTSSTLNTGLSYPLGPPGVGAGGVLSEALDVWGNTNGSGASWNPQPGPYRGSTSKYSDRVIRLLVQLPNDINAAYGGATWWKIQYSTRPGGSPTDRTTWTVTMKGSPVRLIPE
jgi:hypothetical protein